MKDIRIIKLVFIIIAILMAALSGCAETSSPSAKTNKDSANFNKRISNIKNQEVKDKDAERAGSTVFQVTSKDIDEAKLVIEKHFISRTRGDLEGFKETLGRYKDGFADQVNIKEEFKRPKRYVAESINYPGKYHAINEVPSSYVNNYHKKPYQVIVLHVVFAKYADKDTVDNSDCDYILIKDTKNSPWLIHDWGY